MNAFKFLLIILLLTYCTPIEKHAFEDGVWVDLTHDYSYETLYWPTSDTWIMDTVFVGQTDGGYYYEAFKFSTAEHGGTHLDAPIHFSEGKQTVDELSIDQLSGYAIVIDVSGQVEENRDYQILPEDIKAWEVEHGSIPDGSILLFHTGLGTLWPDAELYLGTTLRGAEGVANLSFPGIHPDAARWLVENRSIKAVGLDTPSLDYGKSTEYMTHRILFEKNIPGFENVANLDRLPTVGAYVMALPMKIKDGSGAPLRIVANIPK
ncbi:MAG: cyclase family protein [Balneolaceae bacterium]|nr:cyclase family protein [Balneolaceae bacterium]MBO6545516.1 cyclase family protein [Balneolaceae bacterium]MBO6646912.1 cyclase family protein [Balneolaceae bacterium]